MGCTRPESGKKQKISPYAYTSNNPINRIDPDGNTDYRVNENGYVKWEMSVSNFLELFGFKFSETDRLFNGNSNASTDASKGILGQLAGESNIKQEDRTGRHTVATNYATMEQEFIEPFREGHVAEVGTKS